MGAPHGEKINNERREVNVIRILENTKTSMCMKNSLDA